MNESGSFCSSLNEIESVDRNCFKIKIEYSSGVPIAPAKISTVIASKAETKQYFEVALSRAEQTVKAF